MRDPYICYRTQCQYHAGRADGNVPSCNYFLVTGKTKTSQGEADITRKCGLFQRGDKTPLPQKPQSIVISRKSAEMQKKFAEEDRRRRHEGKKYDWAVFRAMWEEGKTDKAIAREIGCHHDTVRNWRLGAGLAPNVHKSAVEPEKLRKLWAEGLNDAQIAARCGASRQAAQKVRARLGLPAHNQKARKR